MSLCCRWLKAQAQEPRPQAARAVACAVMRLPLLALAALLLLTSPTAAAEAPAAPAAKGVRTIYLVRHGLYDRDDQADDRVGNGINAVGREQATLVGRYLAALPVRMNSLTSSTLTRARETADLMGAELGMSAQRDSLLSECTPISERADWMRDENASEMAGCERQLAAAWEKYVRPSPAADSHEILVAHGNVIRWFLAKALADDSRKWSRLEVGHASITAITVSPEGRVRVSKVSDATFMPVALQTYGSRGPGWK